jgi:transglutaminase-like putative cysteine protease
MTVGCKKHGNERASKTTLMMEWNRRGKRYYHGSKPQGTNKLNIPADEERCLRSTFFLDCDHHDVKEKSKELTAHLAEAKDKAVRLFSFVRDEIRYNVYAARPADTDFKASHVLAVKEGYCVQKAVLLAALARAAGIPARLRFAEIRAHLTSPELVSKRGSNVFPYHGLTDLYIDGRWVKATPTYDRAYCEKMNVTPVEFNGKDDAMLPLRTNDGRLNVEYIRDRGFFVDLPLEEIRKASVSWRYMEKK